MDRYLEQLADLLPPPAEEIAGPPWERSRREVGFDFPSDYRAFVDRYGGGYLEEPDSLRFSVYAPSSVPRRPGQPVGFEGFVSWHASEFASIFEDADELDWGGTVYPLYPAPGGLLVWGANEQGDVFWWLTEGDDPDAWPVVMWARGPVTTYRFDVGMVRFLHAIVSSQAPSFEGLHMPQARWTLTSDWLRRDLDSSSGPTA